MLSANNLEKAQSMTMPTIISHMGYNCNMPKTVIYAPTTHGGLSLKHVHTEQGYKKHFNSSDIFKHAHSETYCRWQSMPTNFKLAFQNPSSRTPLHSHGFHTNGLQIYKSSFTPIILENLWMIPPRHNNSHLIHKVTKARLPPEIYKSSIIVNVMWKRETIIRLNWNVEIKSCWTSYKKMQQERFV